jgi:hypothetical protein
MAQRAADAAVVNTEIAQKSMVYAQRAYVSIESISILTGTIAREGFFFYVKNFGATPANDVQIFVAVEVSEKPSTQDIDSVKWIQIGLLAPQGRVSQTIHIADPMTPEQRIALQQGKSKFYCSGVIRYKDIFGEARQTKFCFRQIPRSADVGPCEGGNEAD